MNGLTFSALLVLTLAGCADAAETGPLPPTRALADAPVFHTVPSGIVYGSEVQVGELEWEVKDIIHLAGRKHTEALVSLTLSHQEAGPRRVLLLPRVIDSHGEIHAPAGPSHGQQPTLALDPLVAPPVEPGAKVAMVLRYELPTGHIASRLELPGLSPVAGVRELNVAGR
jgi:hypothetical protein